MKDAVDEGLIKMKGIKSGENHTDTLTKALCVKSFEEHRNYFLNARA